jgi:diguanylate cyclase (GGDEF)-like protein
MQRAPLGMRAATLCAGLILVVSLGFVIATEAVRLRAATALHDSVRIGRAYAQAVRALDRERVDDEAYRLSPSPSLRTDDAALRATFRAALSVVASSATTAQRGELARIDALHERYARAVDRAFAAVDRTDERAAKRIEKVDADPAFAEAQQRLDAFGPGLRGTLLGAVQLQNRFARFVPVAAALAGISLVALLSILRAYRLRDEAFRRNELERLREAAHVDHLTGLGNARAFDDDVARLIADSSAGGDAFSLALVDIDDFKIVNDRFGHIHGDDVLRVVGELLGSLPSGFRAYRIGGDEFAIVAIGLSDARLLATVQTLRAEARRRRLGVTTSIGIATHRAGDPAVELHEQADAALYEAKRRGRDGAILFADIASGVGLLPSSQAEAVRRIVAEGAVDIVFQPIWDLRAGNVLGYEALARFPALAGSAGTQDVFDIATRLGRGVEIDAMCRRAVFAKASSLPEASLLFLNVSPQSIEHDLDLGDEIASDAKGAGIAPARVVVEITERGMTRPAAVIEAVQRMRRLGLKVALDDVGAGNGGLEMLTRLFVEFVKVDRSVVALALDQRSARSVLVGIIAIARESGAFVVAQGIENDAMLAFARSIGPAEGALGTDGGQGSFLGEPGPDFREPVSNS